MTFLTSKPFLNTHAKCEYIKTKKRSHVTLYAQEALWKSAYVCLSILLCLLVCVSFFDVFLFHHASFFFTATHSETFMTLDVTEAFSTMLSLSTYITCVCVLPLGAYCFLTFINPCCFRFEAVFLLCFTGISAFLFLCSYGIALFCICPFVWHFFLGSDGNDSHSWHYAPRLMSYMHSLLSVLCTTHVLFQLPCMVGFMQLFWHMPQPLNQRKRIHVLLLLVSGVICPPDVLTQTSCWLCFICVCESLFFFVSLFHLYRERINESSWENAKM